MNTTGPYNTIFIRAKSLKSLSFNESKAIALLVWVKNYQKINPSVAKDYTLNDLHRITGLHYDTIKKRLLILEGLGMLGYSGRKNHYTFLRIRAHNDSRNRAIEISETMSVKQVEKLILAIRLQLKIYQKEFLRNTLSIAQSGRDKDGKSVATGQVKRARRYLREHYNADYRSMSFTDNGWSYKSIAKYLGTSITKAFDVVSFAVARNLFSKMTDSIKSRISSDFDQYFRDYTFIYHGYMFTVSANRYNVL